MHWPNSGSTYSFIHIVLHGIINLIYGIKIFFFNPVEFLNDFIWLMYLRFLTDICIKLIDLNYQLQGKGKNVADFIFNIKYLQK